MKKRTTKTVYDWEEKLKADSEGCRGRFRLLSREMLNSKAFRDLGGSGTIVVLAILDKLEYEKAGKRDRKGVKSGVAHLRNGGEFYLTIGELQARGLTQYSATRARLRAWELGFFDVIAAGTVHRPGIYRYSERWRHYPHGNYLPHGQAQPGMNIYPDHGFKKADTGVEDDRESTLANVLDFRRGSE